MDKRRDELLKLKAYTEGIDSELTMILQTLQWDRNHLIQNPVLVTCSYDSNHKVPPDKTEEHEKDCFLRQNGYSKDDQLLPDPLDSESNTLVKLGKGDIEQIICNASRSDLLFKKGVGCHGAEPLSLERLQASYSADERRAIHDAVVSAVPSCHDLTDLALLSAGDDQSSKVIMSRKEILLELRNMRRRRTKYRVAAKSRNFSDVLRDVIRTQMEHYNAGKSEIDPKETDERENNERDTDRRHSRQPSNDDRHRYDGKIVPRPIEIKTEREDSTERNRDYSRERLDRAYRNEKGSRDTREREGDMRGRNDRSREKRNDDDHERTQKYGEHSRKRRHDNENKERRNYYEESKDSRRDNGIDKEHRSDKRSRRYYKDNDPQVKKEPGLDEESHNHHKESSRERSRDENRERPYKHKDRHYDDDRRRYREKSRERRKGRRHEERPSERIHITQEKGDSVTRDDTINYEKERDRSRKSDDRRYGRSYRDRNYDNQYLEIKQERYDWYYDEPSEEIYDPNKKIKVE